MDQGTKVELVIGATHREVRIARLVTGGVAAAASFDLESTDDARIAVDEACVWLVERGDGSPLRLTFDAPQEGRLEVSGTTGLGSASATGEVLSMLVEQILAAACSQHEFHVGDAQARFRLVVDAVRLPPVAP